MAVQAKASKALPEMLHRRFWRRLWRSTRGSIAAETAFILPILILMALGGTEIARYVLLHQKLNRVVATMSDLVSQGKTISEDEINALFAAVDPVMSPFSVGDDGVVIVSSITDTPGNPARVVWQRCGGGSLTGQSSEFGAEGAIATLPSGFVVRPGEGVIVAEVIYHYTPLISAGLVGSQTIYHRALFRPRFGTLESVSAPGTPSSCS